MVINGNVDDVMMSVMKNLGIVIPDYKSDEDPTRNADMTSCEMDWTIPTSWVKEMKLLYKKVCKPTKRKRKTFMYERDPIPYGKDATKATKKRILDAKTEVKGEPENNSLDQNSSGTNFQTPSSGVDAKEEKIDARCQDEPSTGIHREIKEELFDKSD